MHKKQRVIRSFASPPIKSTWALMSRISPYVGHSPNDLHVFTKSFALLTNAETTIFLLILIQKCSSTWGILSTNFEVSSFAERNEQKIAALFYRIEQVQQKRSCSGIIFVWTHWRLHHYLLQRPWHMKSMTTDLSSIKSFNRNSSVSSVLSSQFTVAISLKRMNFFPPFNHIFFSTEK